MKLHIDFAFNSDFNELPVHERDLYNHFLLVEGLLEIKINDAVYFYEEYCALLAFYLQLEKWLAQPFAKRGDFLYHTLELDEEEPFLAVNHFQDQAQLHVIWPEADLYNVFPADYLHKELEKFCFRLGPAIEQHYQLQLRHFR
ncbi:hypothetical protein [Terribacillus sp. DMT04]|uniref:DUF7878 domain-containing protein n=1 Tax=Terribacillus sp. DMT04 TaxID=2850441 RepID=UPI001C2BA7D7|nr:hypothetical protein [Terribacillus sp. DMT04]QXE01899.1 hypothetical protein KS242_01115 [Terribacillus sp. DMT04]